MAFPLLSASLATAALLFVQAHQETALHDSATTELAESAERFGSEEDDDQELEPTVGFELLSNTSHVTPGARFLLGVRFQLPEHWHVYWTNSGESGMPTKVELEAPEGFVVEPVKFPGPQRIEVAGGLVSYGYERELLIMVPVTAPAQLKTGETISFQVKGRWLVCKTACFLQRQTADLQLQSAAREGDSIPREVNNTLFSQYRAQLPRSQAELNGLTSNWTRTGNHLDARLDAKGADKLEFFPTNESDLDLLSSNSSTNEHGAAVSLRLDGSLYDAKKQPALRGLLAIERKGKRQYYHFATPIPALELAEQGSAQR